MADEESNSLINVRVEGMEEAKQYLRELALKILETADRIIEDGGEKIFALSQKLVPVDTGTLQRSGSHKHEPMKSEVGYNTPYAAFVHDGTSVMPARPYLRGAAEAALPSILKKAQEEIAKL